MRSVYARSNRILRMFSQCSIDVKIVLFNSYCTPLYCSYLWREYKKTSFSKIRVAFNNAYRRIFGLSNRSSASAMYANYVYNICIFLLYGPYILLSMRCSLYMPFITIVCIHVKTTMRRMLEKINYYYYYYINATYTLFMGILKTNVELFEHYIRHIGETEETWSTIFVLIDIFSLLVGIQIVFLH